MFLFVLLCVLIKWVRWSKRVCSSVTWNTNSFLWVEDLQHGRRGRLGPSSGTLTHRRTNELWNFCKRLRTGVEAEEDLRNDCWMFGVQQIVAPPPCFPPTGAVTHWQVVDLRPWPWCFRGHLTCFLPSCLRFLGSSQWFFPALIVCFTSCWEIKLQKGWKTTKRLLKLY